MKHQDDTEQKPAYTGKLGCIAYISKAMTIYPDIQASFGHETATFKQQIHCTWAISKL
jgi:hypothetical protein